MKKRITFFAFAAALAFCYSCSNDETVASQATSESNEISFRPLMNNMTRATDAALGTTGSFKVTAFAAGNTTGTPYIDEVTFTGAAGTYTSGDKYYWPANNGLLDFYAWSPVSVSAGDSNYDGFTITPSTTVSEQIDLIYAVTKGWGKTTKSGSNGVTINFRHAESKIKFKVSNSNPNLKITVGTVTIKNLRGTETFTWNGVTDGNTSTAAGSANTDGHYTTGTLTRLNGSWTETSAQTSYYTTPAMSNGANYNLLDGNTSARDLYDGSNETATSYDMILIPQTLKTATAYPSVGGTFDSACLLVQLKIQNTDGTYILGGANDYITAMWPLTALTWLPGHMYTYTIDLASGGYYETDQDSNVDLDPIFEGAEIKFVTVTVDEWADGGAGGVYVGS